MDYIGCLGSNGQHSQILPFRVTFIVVTRYMYEIIPCFLRLAHVNSYLTFQKLISDGVDGEYLAESRTQTRRAIETLCSAAVVKLASARHPKPSLPSPQELSQRKSFPPLPLTHSLSFSLLGVLSLPAAHLVGCLSRPFRLPSPPFQTLRKTHEGQRERRPYPCPVVNEEENGWNACQLETFRFCM